MKRRFGYFLIIIAIAILPVFSGCGIFTVLEQLEDVPTISESSLADDSFQTPAPTTALDSAEIVQGAEIADKMTEITENKSYYGGATLAEELVRYNIPAISITIIDNYQISGVYTQGVKNKESQEKVTADTLFQAASISKSVFAVAIMRLVEEGTLDLDADITEYLSDYELPTYDGQNHKITLRQILSHCAGLNIQGFYGYQKDQEIPTIEQILNGEPPANSVKLQLVENPETVFQYSSGGYVLAQKIMTDVCGREFADIMNDLVLLPISMTRSTYSQPLPDDRLKEIAYGHSSGNRTLPGGYYIMPELSAAGLWTTPSDLALFGIEIMKAIKNKSSLLKNETAELMIKAAYDNDEYGLGFELGSCGKGKTFGHSGANMGYLSVMQFCPVDGSGIVIMQNYDGAQEVGREIYAAFCDIYGW